MSDSTKIKRLSNKRHVHRPFRVLNQCTCNLLMCLEPTILLIVQKCFPRMYVLALSFGGGYQNVVQMCRKVYGMSVQTLFGNKANVSIPPSRFVLCALIGWW